MPPVVAGVVAGGIVGVSAFVGGATIGVAIIGGVVVAGLTIASNLLAPSVPEAPAFTIEAQNRRVTVRQTAQPVELVFGEYRKSGPLCLFEAEGSTQENLHVVVPFAYHRCEGVVHFVVNDEGVHPRQLDGDGTVLSGRFDNGTRLRALSGALGQAADALLVSEVANWTTEHRGQGVCYGWGKLKWNAGVWPNGFQSLGAVLRGALLYDPRDDDAAPDILASTAADPAVFTTDGDHGLTAGDAVWIKGHVGAVAVIPERTAEDRATVGQDYEIDAVPTPASFTLLRRDGTPVALSTGGTGGKVVKRVWSDNWALCCRDWMAHPLGYVLSDAEIDDDTVIAAANISDEQVALTPEPRDFSADAGFDELNLAEPAKWHHGDAVELSTTGTLPDPLAAEMTYYVIRRPNAVVDNKMGRDTVISLAATQANALAGVAIDLTDAGSGAHTVTRVSQRRYTVNGPLKVGGTPVEPMRDLLSAGAGVLTWTAGQAQLFAGAATASSGATTARDKRAGPLKVKTKTPLREAFNCARGTYIDPDAFDTETPIPPYVNGTYVAEDNYKRVFANFDLKFTNDPVAAQRLLKIAVERERQSQVVEFPAKPQKFGTALWDVEALSLDLLGYEDKDFRVVRFAEQPDFGVDLTYREEAPAMWDWNLGEETAVDLAPNSNLPNAFAIADPQNLLLSSGDADLIVAGDGTVFSGLRARWSPPPGVLVARYELGWKLAGAAAFTPAVAPREARDYLFGPAIDGRTYVVRVRAVNEAHVPSNYVEDQHTIVGKEAPPPDATNFSVTRLADGTRRFSASLATTKPADFAGFNIKYQSGASLTWANGTLLNTTGLITAFPYETNALVAGTYTFGCKAVDTSGNESNGTAILTATLGDPPLRGVLLSRVEQDLGWPGDLTDCWITPENTLEAVGDTDAQWDNLGTWDSLGLWSDLDHVSGFVYETEVIDLGADVSFTPIVQSEQSGSASYKMRTHTAAEGSDLSAESYVALGRVSGERYIQLEITVTGIFLYTLVALFDGETLVDDFEDVDTSAETAPWFESVAAGHFKIASKSDMAAITGATLRALQSVGSGWTWELLSKSATVSGNPNPAAEFKVYNATPALADAVVDVELKGPKAT